MDGYGPATHLVSSQSMDVLHLSASEMGDTKPFIRDLNFEGLPLFDNMQSNLPMLPYTPTYEFDTFSTTFDDPLSYQSTLFDNFIDQEANADEQSSPPDLDNKLLGFGAPIHKIPVIDQTGQTWPRMAAELNGMFCVAEDVYEGDATGRPLELTCYRRNLFQISGSITISRTIQQVLIDQCHHVQIYDLVATLSATESIEGKAADIICVPWKTGNATGSMEEKTGTAPLDVPVDLSSNQELDPMFVTIPVAWGRLQFKYATANNGRRKGLQQHYRIHISLTAKTKDGSILKLVEIQSNPIVVRGRSPKNFDSSKDVPLSERKAETRIRNSANLAAGSQSWIEPALSHGSNKNTPQKGSNGESNGWLSQTSPTQAAKLAAQTSPSLQKRRPPVPSWGSKSQEKVATGLSFADEEDDDYPGSQAFVVPEKSAAVNSPPENADLLYEYFPLNLDDWMPPVDAIYRPHVVHHLRIPAEVKAQQGRSKPKRYFSASD